MTMKSVWKAMTLGLMGVVLASAATAAEYEIKMLNNGAGGAMVFEPALLKIKPGDSVTFRAAHKGHNAQSIDVMMPSGASKFQGKINEEIKVTFDQPGVYGYECKPHTGLGMVGLIVVGDPAANLAAAKNGTFRGKAKERFEALFKQVGG